MSPETTIPADLFPDLLLVALGVAWVGPVEIRDTPEPVEGREPIWLPGVNLAPDWPRQRLRLPLSRPECRAQLLRILATGLRCAACEGRVAKLAAGEWVRVPTVAPCANCNGTGWLRKPASAYHLAPPEEGGALPAEHAAHAPALLAAHAMSVARGGPGIVGVLGRWQGHERLTRRALCGDDADVFVCDRGWEVRDGNDHLLAHGPETGPAGRALADAAARAHGYALLDGDTLTLPDAGPEAT